SVPAPDSLSRSPVVEDQVAGTLLRAAATWSLRATGKHTGTNGCVSATDWHANHQMRIHSWSAGNRLCPLQTLRWPTARRLAHHCYRPPLPPLWWAGLGRTHVEFP